MKDLQKMYDELMTSNSKLDKLAILKKYPENKEILKYIYNPMWTYGVTSDNLKKNIDLQGPLLMHHTIFKLLDALRSRKLSGHKAITATNDFIRLHKDYEDLIYLIIDRNLKASIGAKEINKAWKGLIPEFKVQLADKYTEKVNPVGMYSSRKLDGLRCLAIFDEDGLPTFWSRTGKEFLTLDMLGQAFANIDVKDKANMVFDGELCIIDENGKEDFTKIVKIARKKDFTIPNPHYQIFDYITKEEFETAKGTKVFSERYASLKALSLDPEFASVPNQSIIQSMKDFDEKVAEAANKGWEGLIIKSDIGYKGKRSKDLLKVKKFHDAEFIVEGTENTIKKMLNENGKMVSVSCMGNVLIDFKGNTVSVGSGWSDSQRIQFYANPNEIIGKTITVQYFETTVDSKTGLESLRFPTVKHVYENGRDM